MAAVFIEGIIFLLLTVSGLRTKFAQAIPQGYVGVYVCVCVTGCEGDRNKHGMRVRVYLSGACSPSPTLSSSLSFLLSHVLSFFLPLSLIYSHVRSTSSN